MSGNPEASSIYSHENQNLPAWLSEINGRLFYTHQGIEEKKRGPWDYVVDFGRTFEHLREPMGLSDARGAENGRFRIHEDLSRGDINYHALMLTHFANSFELSNPDIQLLYTGNFMGLFRRPLIEGIEYVSRDAVVLAPERGAGVIKLMLQAHGFNREQIPHYQASRIPVGRNYTVAVRVDDESIPQADNVIHVDDCGAAIGTEKTGESIYVQKHGVPKRYAAVFGVGVRSALLYRASELDASNRQYLLRAGAESNTMNPDYYLGVTNQEQEVLQVPPTYVYRVGDMGVAMELDSPARQNDLPVIKRLAESDQWDQLILEVSGFVVNHPEKLVSEVQRLRNQIRKSS